MVDLGPVLELLRGEKVCRRNCPQVGTSRGQDNQLKSNLVPAVPIVPTPNRPTHVPEVAEVMERAAILEFCEGLDRESADHRALGEFVFTSGSALIEAQPISTHVLEPETD